MKRNFFISIVFALFLCPLIKGQTDNAKEDAAIKSVIEGEINASFNGDYNNWTSFFVHQPYLVWMQAWKDGKSCMKGWDKIGSEGKTFVTPDRKGKIVFNGNYDYVIRIYGDAAFVSFRCKSKNLIEQNKETDSMEARLLEKLEGKWKIAYLSSIYTSTY